MKVLRHKLHIDSITRVITGSLGLILVCLILFQVLNRLAVSEGTKGLWYLAVNWFHVDNINIRILKSLLQNPLFVLLLLAALLAEGLLLFWETAGLMICLEYAYERKAIRAGSILQALWVQTRRVIKPKNWPVVLLVGMVVPLFNLYDTSSRLVGWMVPEYVEIFFAGALHRFIIGLILVGIIILITIRLFFSLYYFVLEQREFREAYRLSQNLIRQRTFFTLLCVIGWQALNKLVLEVLPRCVLWIVYRMQRMLVGELFGFDIAADFVYTRITIPIVNSLGTALFTISMLALASYLFHTFKKEQGETEIVFCDEPVQESRVRRWNRRGLAAVYALLMVFILAATPGLTLAMGEEPEIEEILEDPVKVAAHRGYMEFFPENTNPAFYAVVFSKAADYIELDVHPSADGVPVVIHDANTLRTTGYAANISNLTLEEIKELDAGSWFGEEFAGTKIPTLEEVLESYGGRIGFVIEIKNPKHKKGFEKKVVKLIHKYGSTENCLIQSPNYSSLVKVKEYDPDLQCGWIMHFAFGTYYDLPYVDFFSVEHTFINASMVREIHNRGKQIFAWTVNDSRQVQELLGDGVDCIISNKPGLMSRIIARNQGNLDAYMKSYLMDAFYLDYLLKEESDVRPMGMDVTS
ncbi:MAG: glycerophosphodiester phosphodiesterase family protein [Eubacteriales bacterium]|nr:glycerophosphodiester phosphodiesterase family protein [Eubacteriales bacterium]